MATTTSSRPSVAISSTSSASPATPIARSRALSAHHVHSSTTVTSGASPARLAKPRSFSSGGNVDIRRAFAAVQARNDAGIAAAEVAAEVARHREENHQLSGGDEKETPCGAVSTGRKRAAVLKESIEAQQGRKRRQADLESDLGGESPKAAKLQALAHGPLWAVKTRGPPLAGHLSSGEQKLQQTRLAFWAIGDDASRGDSHRTPVSLRSPGLLPTPPDLVRRRDKRHTYGGLKRVKNGEELRTPCRRSLPAGHVLGVPLSPPEEKTVTFAESKDETPKLVSHLGRRTTSLPERPGQRKGGSVAVIETTPVVGVKRKATGDGEQEKKMARESLPRESLPRESPSEDSTEGNGRKLRSQETTRFKSELAAYFPEYDVVIGNDTKPKELLMVDSKIRFIGSPIPDEFPALVYPATLMQNLCNVEIIDYSMPGKSRVPATDPLADSVYEVHRKYERQERTVKNAERVRAQHEKDQIVRILASLQGPDWLRVLGVTAETRKKEFEGARKHFIRGCRGVLDKFRLYEDEERRKKEQEKGSHLPEFPALAREKKDDVSMTEESEEEEEEETEEDDEEERPTPNKIRRRGTEGHKAVGSSSGARQVGRSGWTMRKDSSSKPGTTKTDSSKSTVKPEPPTESIRVRKRKDSTASSDVRQHKRQVTPQMLDPTPTPEVVPQAEFRSFFNKKHEREAAVNRHRRGGRNILAWGVPLPDMASRDFECVEGIGLVLDGR